MKSTLALCSLLFAQPVSSHLGQSGSSQSAYSADEPSCNTHLVNDDSLLLFARNVATTIHSSGSVPDNIEGADYTYSMRNRSLYGFMDELSATVNRGLERRELRSRTEDMLINRAEWWPFLGDRFKAIAFDSGGDFAQNYSVEGLSIEFYGDGPGNHRLACFAYSFVDSPDSQE